MWHQQLLSEEVIAITRGDQVSVEQVTARELLGSELEGDIFSWHMGEGQRRGGGGCPFCRLKKN